MVSNLEDLPVLEETEVDWRPFLNSEMKRHWTELKRSGSLPELVQLVQDCFGDEPWRPVGEEYRALVFVLAFQHQAGEQWASWLRWLTKRLRERRSLLLARLHESGRRQ